MKLRRSSIGGLALALLTITPLTGCFGGGGSASSRFGGEDYSVGEAGEARQVQWEANEAWDEQQASYETAEAGYEEYQEYQAERYERWCQTQVAQGDDQCLLYED